MSRHKPWLGQPQETPLTYVVLLAWAVLMYPGRRAGSEQTLAGWARNELASIGYLAHQGEPWRLLTHAFVHGGLMHVLFNGAALVAFGPGLERWLGSKRFALVYFVGALASAIAGVFWHGPWTPLVGGSGAIFAMMGAVLALNMRAGRHLLDFLDHAGSRAFLGLVLANLILGWVIPNVSNAAHLGGLLAGFVLTFCFLERGHAPTDRVSRAAQAGWLLLLLSTTLYTCWPTARGDYLLARAIEIDDPAQRRVFLRALRLAPVAESRPDLGAEEWYEMIDRDLRDGEGK